MIFPIISLALAAAMPDTSDVARPDTVQVDFPFVKRGPVRLFSLTDGKRNGGRDSISGLEGGKEHVTDSATYQKLIPLRLEIADRSDSGTIYRISYIGYRENPGFRYMWNSSAFRYRYSHQLDYETEPIPHENVGRSVRMTQNLQVYDDMAFGLLVLDANLSGSYMYRLNAMPYYEELGNSGVYLGSSLLSVAFMREGRELRISGNALSFAAADIAWFLQTNPGGHWPLNPGQMFGPVAYVLHLVHAAPNAQVLVPVYKKTLLLRGGMNTDWFPKGRNGELAFGVNGEVGVRMGSFAVFAGLRDQLTATSTGAMGLRYALSVGLLRFGKEPRNYFH